MSIREGGKLSNSGVSEDFGALIFSTPPYGRVKKSGIRVFNVVVCGDSIASLWQIYPDSGVGESEDIQEHLSLIVFRNHNFLSVCIDKVSLVAKACDMMGKIGDAIGFIQILTKDYSNLLG